MISGEIYSPNPFIWNQLRIRSGVHSIFSLSVRLCVCSAQIVFTWELYTIIIIVYRDMVTTSRASHVWIQSESRNIYHIVLILIVKKILSQGSEKCLFHWPICQEAWRPSQSFSPPLAPPPPPPHLPTLDAPGRAPAPPPPHLLPPGDAQVRGRHFSPPPRPHRHPRRQVRPSRDCCWHLQVGKALRASAYITHSNSIQDVLLRLQSMYNVDTKSHIGDLWPKKQFCNWDHFYAKKKKLKRKLSSNF